ncbi:ammonium transporter, partial [Candidatus Poribacteria bacterium]|nr:ammonium transporter [Candidatus Poribacteria bacterium]
MKSLPRGARALAISFVGLALVLAAVSGPAQAQEAEVSESVRNYVNEALQGDGDHSFNDYLWMMVAGFLVFFMQAGFAMVEAGFTRAKNAVNILMKNFM